MPVGEGYNITDTQVRDSSFSHLGNSGNSAISVQGKDLTKIKIYKKESFFSNGKI